MTTNIYFERKGFEDRYKEKYKSIDLWENKLKKGEPLTFEECHTIKKKMTNESWENKMFKAMVKDGLYDINTLKNKYGLIIGLILRFFFHFFKKENKKPDNKFN